MINSLIYECIIIENNIKDINQDNQIIKKSKTEKDTIINFYPEEENDLKKFLVKIIEFGKINKENILKNNNIEENICDIEIKTTNKELNGISIELNTFNSEKFNKYYPSHFKFEDDEIVFSFCFEGKNINSFDSFIEKLNKIYPQGILEEDSRKKAKILMRKENNRLLLDAIFKKDFNELTEIIFDININLKELMDISLILKNTLKVEEFLKLEFDKFFISFFSAIILLKFIFKNIQNIWRNLEAIKENLIKELEIKEKEKEKEKKKKKKKKKKKRKKN